VKLQALRGAITCDEDSRAEIDAKTARLVKEMFARNDLTPDDVVSIIFTSTPDLHAQFPASAARTALGLDDIALLGAVEQEVPHGMARCIRVLVHCYTDKPRDQLRHVFLEGATTLRSDLSQ
jgi:chorismate mutase